MSSSLTCTLPMIISSDILEYIYNSSWILLINRLYVIKKKNLLVYCIEQFDRYNNPTNKCTKLCYKGEKCPNINGFLNCRYLKCTFAHNSSELRQEECWFNGRCTNLNCNRYHSEPRYCRRCGDVLSKNCRCN